MLTWRMFAVVVQYTAGHPTAGAILRSHPYGLILVGAVAQALFGHNSFSIHAPAIIYGTFIPPLIFGIARATWGYVAGAIATVVFVLVPIDLAFAKFGLYELTTIFWDFSSCGGPFESGNHGRRGIWSPRSPERSACVKQTGLVRY